MCILRNPKGLVVSDALDSFLRLPQVIEIVGLSKAMIYRKARAGTFPKPYKPGGASSRWSRKEVADWLSAVKNTRS
jgi:prophage regulatory protein